MDHNRTAKILNTAFGKSMGTFGPQANPLPFQLSGLRTGLLEQKSIFAIHIHHGNEVPINILIDSYVVFPKRGQL